MSLHETLDLVIDRVDAAAKKFGIKALAPLIRGDLSAFKAESTLRNELSQQPGYKLGVPTLLQILLHTRDLSPLDAIEEFFGRTAWRIPTIDKADPLPLMAMTGSLAEDTGRTLKNAASAMADGKITRAECAEITARLDTLITTCLRFKAVIQRLSAAISSPRKP